MSDVNATIENEIKSQDVVVFMKGTPQMPQCGFSGQVVQILNYLGVPFKGVNVLADQGAGQRIRPYGSEGPEVLAASDKAVRSEFCAAYPADGESDEQRNDAKAKAFKRARKQALDRGLIAARELGGIDHLWLVTDEPA